MKLLYAPKLKLRIIMYSTRSMSTPFSTICTIFVQVVSQETTGISSLASATTDKARSSCARA
jgi:hypothetical protein